jgi:anti-sigma B factor antagonist
VSSSDFSKSAAEQFVAQQLAADVRANRRTALVELRGELDLATVSKVADLLDGLETTADGIRHIVLDLRGLTFMDSTGLHELLRQSEYARTNRHNLAVVRGSDAIQRLLQLTHTEELLVLVDDPDDLAPPTSPAASAGNEHDSTERPRHNH